MERVTEKVTYHLLLMVTGKNGIRMGSVIEKVIYQHILTNL